MPEEKNFLLPLHYNEIIQGFIYKHLSPSLAEKIHNQGFVDPETGRRFKLFTFSRLIPEEKPIIKNHTISFSSPFNLIVASVDTSFIQDLVENLLTKEKLTLNEMEVRISSVEVLPLPKYQPSILVKTLSPITVYTTFDTKEEKKKRYYFNPKEKDFEIRIIENLRAKLRAWLGKNWYENRDGRFVKVIPQGTFKKKVIVYKKTVINAWDGNFILKLPEEMFRMAFLTGLGAKNSAGFGCLEIKRN